MKAYEVGDYASSRRVRLVDRPDPQAGPGEALIRVRATSPNARDYAIMSTGNFKPPRPPEHIPLGDVAGEVLEVGPGVTKVVPGERVTMQHYWRWLDGPWDFATMREDDFGQTRDGFLRELAAVPADALVPIPGCLSFEEACTLPSAGLTAWQAVVATGKIAAGETMVTIGTGGVSVFALQFARMHGARVIVTSSSDKKLERLRELGADGLINYRNTPDWHLEVRKMTGGRGANMVINNVGLAELDRCLESCDSGGRIMFVGASPVSESRIEEEAVEGPRRLPLLIIRDLTLKGIVVGSRRMLVDMIDRMVQHDVRPVIDRVYDFAEANEALAYASGWDKIGKIVIRMPAACS
jgi:NADPH:quinone reductase-like Zn-dependent oxidoreductase